MGTRDLKGEQERTLATPRLRYGLLARALFLGMDLFFDFFFDLIGCLAEFS